MPQLGNSVGYLAWLKLPDGRGTNYFGSAFVSAMKRPTGGMGVRWMLSEGLIQSGFSGSAVFTPEGSILGVITDAFRFPVSVGLPGDVMHTRILMSPLGLVLRHVGPLFGQ
jgi:hypothetical protein